MSEDNSSAPEDDAVRVRRTIEGILGVPATEGNQIDVLVNGDRIFAPMLEAIGGAEHTIDFLTFIYWDGEIGTAFAEALCAKATAGVRVRVLLDSWGAEPMDHPLTDKMEACGVDLRWFRPLRRFRPGEINHRTHRKVLVVDESVAFTGGVGIADEWKGDARDENEWRDTHFRVEGPAVDGLRAAFLDNWSETGAPIFEDGVDRFPEQPKPGRSVVQCVRGAAEIGQSDVAMLLRTLVQLARRRLRVTTAYFVPDDDLVERLCAACERGVQVQLLLPGPHTDKRFVQLLGEAEYATLLAAGVEIWCFQPSMLHAKVLTVDGVVATIGSANMNTRSTELDEEINLVVVDAELVATLDAQFEVDLERSVALDPSRWEDRSLGQRAAETLARPLKALS